MALVAYGQIHKMCGEFHKVLKMRLNDQGAISTLPCFVTRRALSIDYKFNVYINQIRHPDIRLIYTRLGAYLNILSTSRASKKQYETCPLCQSEPETVTHFILRCPFRPKDTISLIVSRTFIHISL